MNSPRRSVKEITSVSPPPSFLLLQPKTRKVVEMAKTSGDQNNKNYFYWAKRVGVEEDDKVSIFFKASLTTIEEDEREDAGKNNGAASTTKTMFQSAARRVVTVFGKNPSGMALVLGSRVIGTLFGCRRGHVHFAFQRDPVSSPALLIELSSPITGLVREMASGLVRIVLECDKEKREEKKGVRLLQEPIWRTYCNGKKYGFAIKRECGLKEWKVLKAVEPISTGAGVLPGTGSCTTEAGAEGEVIYMRAIFDRIVGSRDSEAFYMINPDNNGATELSIYLLRL